MQPFFSGLGEITRWCPKTRRGGLSERRRQVIGTYLTCRNQTWVRNRVWHRTGRNVALCGVLEFWAGVAFVFQAPQATGALKLATTIDCLYFLGVTAETGSQAHFAARLSCLWAMSSCCAQRSGVQNGNCGLQKPIKTICQEPKMKAVRKAIRSRHAGVPLRTPGAAREPGL